MPTAPRPGTARAERVSERSACPPQLALIVRSQLNPHEEAIAVNAMLDCGLTEAGAAQALGWSPQRVSARVKLLELPEAAQRMIGEGRIALSAIDQLRAIGSVSPPLLDALIAFLADGNEWAAERLAREPGWVGRRRGFREG